jgi:hypothetical protein
MPKHILVCSDGTWDGAENTPGACATNVLKLFNSLAGDLTVGTPADPQQERTALANGAPSQIAKYIHGVGDSSNWLDQKLGGYFGTGLVARVLRGYSFVSRNYAVGDSIVLVGFSRGAYTARALAGFITTMGLLDWSGLGLGPNGSDMKGYQLAASAWYRYQQQRRKTDRSPFWLARLEEFMAQMPELASALMLKPKYIANVRIAAVGVWDTVGALGIPELSKGHDTRLDLLRFADTGLSPMVDRGFHAIAADEQRVEFSPTLWDPDPARIAQCFFPGAHSDVGGGYPSGAESMLSDVALSWMVAQLTSCGVSFRVASAITTGAEPGPMHLPWATPPFSLLPNAIRDFPAFNGGKAGISVHPALLERIGKDVAAIATTPAAPTTKAMPYLPLALVNAGYLDLSGIRIRK